MISAASVTSAARGLDDVARVLDDVVPALVDGSADAAAKLLESGSSLNRYSALVDDVLRGTAHVADSQTAFAGAEQMREAAERLLVHAGGARAGALPDAATLGRDVEAAVELARDAGRALDQRAYFLRAAEGTSRAAPLGEMAQRVIDRAPPATGAAQADQMRELLGLASSRTPRDNAIGLLVSKFGDRAVWDEYIRLFRAEFGDAPARRVSEVVHQLFDDVTKASEGIKVRADAARPFQVDPRSLGIDADALTTVVNRPQTRSYLSGHMAKTAAAARKMAEAWPERAEEFGVIDELMHWSRRYGGVHWRADVDAGRILGRELADRAPSLAGVRSQLA